MSGRMTGRIRRKKVEKHFDLIVIHTNTRWY